MVLTRGVADRSRFCVRRRADNRPPPPTRRPCAARMFFEVPRGDGDPCVVYRRIYVYTHTHTGTCTRALNEPYLRQTNPIQLGVPDNIHRDAFTAVNFAFLRTHATCVRGCVLYASARIMADTRIMKLLG